MSALADTIDDLVRLNARPDEQAVLDETVDIAVRSTGARSGSAVLLGPTGTTHVSSRGRGALEPGSAPGDDPLVRDVLQTRCAVRRADSPRGGTLAAPIVADGPLLGVLCVADPGDGGFGDDHEVVVTALARQAAWAVSGLRAQRAAAELGERLDEPATAAATTALQVTLQDEEPMRAVDRILDVARNHLGMSLAIVSRIGDGVQRYDRMSGAAQDFGVAVGQAVPLEATYCHAVLEGRISGLIPDAAADPFAAAQNRRLGLGIGAYCGVPLRLPDGELYGSLCTISPDAEPLVPGDLAFLRALADLIGHQLERHERRERERRERNAAVDACLAPGGLQVVVQPIVDLTTGSVAGVEALSRFPSWDGGSPADVFDAAHQVGRGNDLELAAIDAALRLLPDLPRDVYLSINAGPATVRDERLLGRVAREPRGRIVMEITEHVQVSDYPPLLAALDRLAKLGVAVAVDDAGSGFASLQHVLTVSPQLIKLDVTLVRGVDTDPSRRALARAMVLFAEELGARLVAEGVETAAELLVLRELGVRYGQGFHLARPAPLGEQVLLRR
ncbi:EAL domain-containing protein (putative c-di-GMP-specific phosphodiesterase class I) [Kineococcus xinjiangensis]|uniref:EAL domain-containing protein (Putative c-di-GMP-specific phosphodiesterase class I) n=1 Tax=Kineococcus xinjiangensis TaxID=512762 RepID=A0A2S6IHX8_9ACTN|nr:EAL domain-containing protein [Kineococcus xinjiangensis]PPK93823.1 EAL domain-containing protein (putative c-di-GMP-specific phosphodiesterase class I) [Kineococcus xinjiangensis]